MKTFKKNTSKAIAIIFTLTVLLSNLVIPGTVVNAEPQLADITVTNNIGNTDSVAVANVPVGTTVTVYDAAAAGNVLGTASNSSGNMASVTVTLQLTAAGGNVYVSETDTVQPLTESNRITAAYNPESTLSPVGGDITVTNNTGAADTIAVANVVAGTVVTVYDAATNGNTLGTATATGTTVTVNVTLTPGGGTAYITKTDAGLSESARVSSVYAAEAAPQSAAPAAGDITVTNNIGAADTIIVANVVAGTVVTVYDAATNGNTLGTATATGTTATVNVTLTPGGGTAYITKTDSGLSESTRVSSVYTAEAAPQSVAPAVGDITVKNFVTGLNDKIVVTNVPAGATIQVYDAAVNGLVLGFATETGGNTVTISLSNQLSSAGGTAYVTSTEVAKGESARTAKTYIGEPLPWSIYDHTGNWGEGPYPIPGDSNLAGNTYNKHIIIKNGGSRITFYGYGAPAYNDFLYLPNSDAGQKTFTFSMDVSTLNFHSMQGAGVLFNTIITAGKISGYALLYTADSKFTLYELNNVDVNTLHNSGNNLASTQGVTTNATKFNPAAGNIHALTIVADATTLSITDNGTQVASNFTLPTNYGNGLGLLAAYQGHGCPILSYFTITNVNLVGVPYSWPIFDLTAQRGNPGECNLTFSAPTGAEEILLQQSTDGINFTTATSSPVTGASTAATVTSLDDSKRYFFRLLVGGGTSEGISNTASVSAPMTDLAATGANASANLTFTAPDGATNVVVQKSTDGTNFNTAATSAAVNQGSSSATVTGLTNGQQYYLRLVVTSGAYAGTSNVVTVTPTNPITNLAATPGNASVALTFTAPTGATQVVVEQSTDGTNFTTATTDPATVTNASTGVTVTGLTNGQQYSFRLVVTGGARVGTSNIATATPVIPATAPVASNVAVTGITKVGQTLTGSYSYSDINGDVENGTTFKWYRSDTVAGLNKAAINGATTTTYQLVSEDVGKYISFEATPMTTVAPTTGTPVESTLTTVVTVRQAPEPTPTPTPVTVKASVVSTPINQQGTTPNQPIAKPIEATVYSLPNGTKTVVVNSEETLTVTHTDGTTTSFNDQSKVSFVAQIPTTTTGTSNAATSAPLISMLSNGTISVSGLPSGSDSTFAISFDLGGGQKITIGSIHVVVSDTGEVNLTSTLIDPYGTITDKATGKPIEGIRLVLYFANTPRNIANGKAVDTMVNLPEIPGFKPNNNVNPQISTAAGEYGWMVYPNADYYIIAEKAGYNSYKSPTISVEQEIVKFDFPLAKKNLTAPVITLAGQADISIWAGDNYTESGAVAVDSFGTELTKVLSTSGAVDVTKPGDYTISYTVTDDTGNKTTVMRTIHVRQVSSPVILLKGTAESSILLNESFTDPGMTASDYKGLDITASVAATGSVDTTKVGDYKITYTVKDDKGNAAELVRVVHVTAPPVIVEPVEKPVIKKPVVKKPAVKAPAKTTIKASNVKAVVVAGETDSISGSVLVAKTNGQIVKTKNYSTIKNNKLVNTVYILGGTDVVSTTIEKTIKSYGVKNVVRLGGANAHETSSLIVNYLKAAKGTPVLLISSTTSKEMIKAAIAKNINKHPVILTTPNMLNTYAKKSILSLKPSIVYAVGGTKAINSAQITEISKMLKTSGKVIRIQTMNDIAKIK